MKKLRLFHLILVLFVICSFNDLKSQNFYSLNELYVHGRLGYNFYEGVDVNLGIDFRVPFTANINFPLRFEISYFGEGLNLYGKKVAIQGIGASLSTYYALMDLGQITGITVLESIGVVGGISTFYEYYTPTDYLSAPELAKRYNNLSWGINLAPVIKVRFSERVSGFFQYTMYILPTSPFGAFRNSLGIGVQYNL